MFVLKFLIMKVLLLITFISSFCLSFSQKVYPAGPELPWKVTDVVRNGYSEWDQYDFSKGYIYPNTNEVITTVHKSEGGSAIIKVNNLGKIVWESKIAGAIGLAKINGTLITFYIKESEEGTKQGDLYGIVANIETGKVISEKKISHFTDIPVVTIVTDSKSNFQFLTCSFQKARFGNRPDELDVMYIDEKLSLVNQKKYSFDHDDNVLRGVASNSLGDCFIASIKESKSLSIERINRKGESVSTISIDGDFKSSSVDEKLYMKVDENNNEKIVAAWFLYDKEVKNEEFILSIFDFSDKKVKSIKQPFNKELINSLKDKAEINKKLFNHFNHLVIQGFAITSDKIVTVCEIKRDDNNYYFNDAIIVIVYDSNLGNPVYYTIPRGMIQDYRLALSTGFHVQGNKLLIPFADRSGIKDFHTYLCTIDLSTSKQEIIEIEKPDLKASSCVEPDATFWFDNNFILQYVTAKGFLNNKKATYFRRVDY